MFEPDNSGTFGWLSALIVLVMVGIGLSLLTDRRFELSSNGQKLKTSIEKDFAVLEGIRNKHERALGELTQLEKSRNPQARELSELQEQSTQAKERISALTTRMVKLQSEVATTQKSFDAYALGYRNQVWQAAIGEKIPSIALRNGRRYEEVAILKVTTVGLEISHRDGRARIDFQDLDASWQERFLWNSNERGITLAAENPVLPEPAVEADPAPASPTRVSTTKPPAPQPDLATARKLHAELVGLNNRISTLKLQCREAQSNIGSKQNSPPGSLETWSQRASRLNAELNQVVMKREMTRLRLADLDPNDPLASPNASDY